MIGQILFVGGTLVVSVAVTYAFWAEVRVMRLRQDILDKRDALFDLAAERGGLDDPAYKAARKHLNAIAQSADEICIPLFVYWLGEGVKRDGPTLQHADSVIQKNIESMIAWCGERILKYLLYETGEGRFLQARARLGGVSEAVTRAGARLTQDWVFSDWPEAFADRCLDTQG